MEEIIEEYGGVLPGAFAALAMMGVVAKLVFSGGILGEFLVRLGNMAC